jgi:hypothetical protein
MDRIPRRREEKRTRPPQRGTEHHSTAQSIRREEKGQIKS